uniref:Uncharacterized protein n=1 Tax=Glossina brevipalpis TaxID=37001 RepID=A0A1A9WC05_9MUSC
MFKLLLPFIILLNFCNGANFHNFSTTEIFGACLNPNHEKGLCVFLENCKYLVNTFLTSPRKDSHSEYLSRSQCGSKDGRPLVCCSNTYLHKIPSIISTLDLLNNKSSLLPQFEQCLQGPTNIKTNDGNIANVRSPWMALLEHTKGNVKQYVCEGSLINNRYIVTAAQCVSGCLSLLKWHLTAVHLGEWNTESNLDCKNEKNKENTCAPNHIRVAIEYAVSHPLYNLEANNRLHDIALLRLAKVIDYTDFIKPICLPLYKEKRIYDFDSLIMKEARWYSSSEKYKTLVQVVPAYKCRRMYKKNNIRIKSSQFCAESQQKKFGGHLAILYPDTRNERKNKNSHYILAGILSFYSQLNYKVKVYTKIQEYVDWILEVIEE